MTEIAQALTDDEPTLVQSIIDCMLKRRPDMYERYSEAAPARTREDVAFHLQHLSGALVAEDPQIFQKYYDWLHGVLLPRGITQEDIDLNFDCMTQVLQETYGEAAASALDYVSQAVDSRGRAS